LYNFEPIKRLNFAQNLKRMRIKFIIFYIMLGSLSTTHATPTGDTVAIKNCIQHYFNAGDNNDPIELGKAFNPAAMMFWVDTTGQMDYFTQNQWKKRLKEATKTTNALERNILNLDITNQICIAKVKSTYSDRVYIDYLALVKTANQWTIVNKVFNRYAPNKPPSFDENSEKKQIASLIETKLKSMDNNDPDLLASAYYPRAMSYYIDNEQIAAVSIGEWVARFDYDKRKGNDANTKAIRKIDRIDVFGNVGYVSFSHQFTDFTVTDKTLVLKISNRWKIINLMITY
jgi:hypothetical protein